MGLATIATFERAVDELAGHELLNHVETEGVRSRAPTHRLAVMPEAAQLPGYEFACIKKVQEIQRQHSSTSVVQLRGWHRYLQHQPLGWAILILEPGLSLLLPHTAGQSD